MAIGPLCVMGGSIVMKARWLIVGFTGGVVAGYALTQARADPQELVYERQPTVGEPYNWAEEGDDQEAGPDPYSGWVTVCLN